MHNCQHYINRSHACIYICMHVSATCSNLEWGANACTYNQLALVYIQFEANYTTVDRYITVLSASGGCVLNE